MTAHFYCWEPAFWLNPHEPDFEECIIELLAEHPKRAASRRVQDLLKELKRRFEGWGEGEPIGQFVDLAVDWSYYHEARLFIVEAAQSHGLHCYDPQAEELYPANVN